MCETYIGVPVWVALLLPFAGAAVAILGMSLLAINRED